MKNILLLSFIIIISSCCKPGKGGDATVVVYPQHHGTTIPNHNIYPDTVFIKYNATNLSSVAPSNFDTYFVGKSPDIFITCSGLQCGKYMFYCTGWDSVRGFPRVTGGLSFTIKHKNRKENTNLIVPVTE